MIIEVSHPLRKRSLVDLKTLPVPAIFRPLLLHLGDAGASRSLMGPRRQHRQLCALPLGPNFHRSVGQIAHGSAEPKSARLMQRGKTEPDALHAAVNDKPNLRFARPHRQVPDSIRLSSSSSIILTPYSRALRSFEPASSPATTRSVLRLTDDDTRAPAASTFCSASERVHCLSEPVRTTVLSRSGPRPDGSAIGSNSNLPFSSNRLRARALCGSPKYSRILRATSGPISRTASRSSSLASCNFLISRKCCAS